MIEACLNALCVKQLSYGCLEHFAAIQGAIIQSAVFMLRLSSLEIYVESRDCVKKLLALFN